MSQRLIKMRTIVFSYWEHVMEYMLQMICTKIMIEYFNLDTMTKFSSRFSSTIISLFLILHSFHNKKYTHKHIPTSPSPSLLKLIQIRELCPRMF